MLHQLRYIKTDLKEKFKMEDCIFCKIANGIIPSKKFYEDDNMIIIADINPQAKLHYLMIPKKHFANIVEMSEEDAIMVGKCLKKVGELADSLGLENGFRIVSNKGKNACQSVNHLHVHILGGEKLTDRMG